MSNRRYPERHIHMVFEFFMYSIYSPEWHQKIDKSLDWFKGKSGSANTLRFSQQVPLVPLLEKRMSKNRRHWHHDHLLVEIPRALGPWDAHHGPRGGVIHGHGSLLSTQPAQAAPAPSFTGFSVGFASTITTSDTRSVLRMKAIRSWKRKRIDRASG